jgi:hypothetical protein
MKSPQNARQMAVRAASVPFEDKAGGGMNE